MRQFTATSSGRNSGAHLRTALGVTDWRTVEDALRESETRFSLPTETSFDGILITVNGVIREANKGLGDMLGYTVEELIGRPALDLIDPESRGLVASRISQGVEGVYEFVGRHRSGKSMMLEAAARTHMIDGQPGRLTAVRAITEKRNLENRFRQAQKMEAVGRLAGGIAHDFNNLLTVIMAYTQMLADDTRPEDPHRDDLEEIRKAATAAASLTRQLLASRSSILQ